MVDTDELSGVESEETTDGSAVILDPLRRSRTALTARSLLVVLIGVTVLPGVETHAREGAPPGRIVSVRQDGKGDFRTVESALSSVKPGEIVEIRDSGTYRVARPGGDAAPQPSNVVIRGARGQWPIISRAEPGPPTFCPAGTWELDHLVFRGKAEDDGHVWIAASAGRLVVRNCVFKDVRFCISAEEGVSEVQIENCVFTGIGAALSVFRPKKTQRIAIRQSVLHNCQAVVIGATTANLAAFEGNIVDDIKQTVFAFRRRRGRKRSGVIGKLRGSDIDRNCYARLDGDVARMVGIRYALRDNLARFLREGGSVGRTFSDLPAWRKAADKDGQSLAMDPQFTDTKGLDFRLRPSSPCRGKADDKGDLGVQWGDEAWQSFLTSPVCPATSTALTRKGPVAAPVRPAPTQPAKPPVRPGAPYAFVRRWPNVSPEWLFERPHAVRTDAEGFVYVLDTGCSRVCKFDRHGKLLEQWGQFGRDEGKLSGPSDLAIAANGDIYIADTYNDRVQVFTCAGALKLSWGGEGDQPGRFKDPRGLALSGDGTVYVADTGNHRVQKFSAEGVLVEGGAWGKKGKSSGEFNNPKGIAVGRDGTVFVADSNNNRIQAFTSTGRFVKHWGGMGSAKGQFWGPAGLCLDAEGGLYVADSQRHRIQKFTCEGRFVSMWGTRGALGGQFYGPVGVSVARDGTIYVADTYNNAIQAFTSSAEPIAKWSVQDGAPGRFSAPCQMAIDTEGHLHVADRHNHRVQVFTSDGEFVREWGKEGREDGHFSNPHGVALNKNGFVFVADTNNNRVQVFRSDGAHVAQWGERGSEGGQFRAPTGIAVGSDGSVYVVDSDNHRVQKFRRGKFVAQWGQRGRAHGQFQRPRWVAVDHEGNVLVTGDSMSRVQKFSPDGKFLAQWGDKHKGKARFQVAHGIAVDVKGFMYVTDVNYIKKYTPDGDYVCQIGGMGQGDGEFLEPMGVAVDRDGQVYIADEEAHCIQVMKPTGRGSEGVPSKARNAEGW